MIGAFIRVASAFIVCAALSSAWGQGEFELKFEEFKDGSHSLAGVGRQWVGRARQKPPQLKGLPDGLSDKVGYFVARPGGQEVLIAVEPSDPAKLLVDTDLDNDLSDEKPLVGTMAVRVYDFGVVSVKGGNPSGESGKRFTLQAYVQRGTVHYLYMGPAGSCAGEVTLGKETYRVAVLDVDLDGRYDRALSMPIDRSRRVPSDFFAIDFNGNGQFESPAREIMPLPEMIRVNDSYFGVEIEPDGSAIRVEKITPRFGTLQVTGASVRLNISSCMGLLQLGGSDGRWQLPVGGYMLGSLQLGAKDEDAVEWMLPSLRMPAELQQFEIREDETTSLEIGPPLILATKVTNRGKAVSIGVTLTGQAGERYLPGATKGKKRLGAPTLKVLDEKGNELASGSFRYG